MESTSSTRRGSDASSSSSREARLNLISSENDSSKRKTLQERLSALIESNLGLENRANLLQLQMKQVNMQCQLLYITTYQVQEADEDKMKEIKKFYEGEMCEARRLLNVQSDDCARYLGSQHSC